MEASHRRQRTTLHSSSSSSTHLHRSLSPSGRFCSSSIAAATAPPRPISPTRVALARLASSSTVRLSTPPRHHAKVHHAPPQKKTCMCSPTTHPGSFRCSLHNGKKLPAGYDGRNSQQHTASYQQLNMRRSAMTNSLVRIGTVEGELVKRALAALIRPSSHSLRRRGNFEPRRSRLSVMSRAEDDDS